jgi:hypothetical protein
MRKAHNVTPNKKINCRKGVNDIILIYLVAVKRRTIRNLYLEQKCVSTVGKLRTKLAASID